MAYTNNTDDIISNNINHMAYTNNTDDIISNNEDSIMIFAKNKKELKHPYTEISKSTAKILELNLRLKNMPCL